MGEEMGRVKKQDEGRESKIGNREKRDNKEIEFAWESHFWSVSTAAAGRVQLLLAVVVRQLDVSETSWEKGKRNIY